MSGKMKSVFSTAYKKSYRNKDYVKDNFKYEYSFPEENHPPHIEEAIKIIKKIESEKDHQCLHTNQNLVSKSQEPS